MKVNKKVLGVAAGFAVIAALAVASLSIEVDTGSGGGPKGITTPVATGSGGGPKGGPATGRAGDYTGLAVEIGDTQLKGVTKNGAYSRPVLATGTGGGPKSPVKV